MAAYLFAEINVTDTATFDAYRQKVGPLVEKFGGKYLVRGGGYEKVEGDWSPQRLVVIEFEDLERAKAFYFSEEYKPVMAIRKSASTGNVLLVEGS
jgi:uncharacterized protein (DUF1330 family)